MWAVSITVNYVVSARLGEIEGAVLSHAAVKEAVVTADQKLQQLVVYFTVHEAEKLENESALLDSMRAHLQAKLPAHMVPGIFMPMQVFALTPSGKINRKVLPTPQVTLNQVEYVAPRDDTEH